MRGKYGWVLWTICAVFLLLGVTVAFSAHSKAVQGNINHVPLIVLDPGHGGFDPGAIGYRTNVEEKKINLTIAMYVKAELEQRGYRVILTRETDQALAQSKLADMEKRREMIENSGADLAMSIHQNSTPDHSASGPVVLYYPSSQEGKQIALAIQAKLNEALKPDRPRAVMPDDSMYILKSGEMPALIVECGFMSNAKEEQLLQEEEYQQKIAKAIADGVTQAMQQP